jgi:hypothetical protein
MRLSKWIKKIRGKEFWGKCAARKMVENEETISRDESVEDNTDY